VTAPARAALAGAVLALASSPVYAGAWVQPRGRGYYKLESRVVRADTLYTREGDRVAIPTVGEYTISLYAEYGLSGRVTGLAYVPGKRLTLNAVESRSSGSPLADGDSTGGLADLDVGIRLAIRKDRPTVVSAGLLLGLPTGDEERDSGLLTGDGEFNQALSLQAGRSFYPRPLYVSGEAGFNHRTEGYSDELRYLVEVGGTIRDRLTLSFRVRAVESLENGDAPVGGSGLYANDQEYVAYGPELHWRWRGRFGVTATVEGATAARNVLAAPAYALGVYWKDR